MKTLLEEIKNYIELTEEVIDAEWGSYRNIEEIIIDGDMPELYNKILSEIAKLS